jgi:proteasome accessory factor A
LAHEVLPKVTGADVEVGNFILNLSRSVNGIGATGAEASRRLLHEIKGQPAHSRGSYYSSSNYSSNLAPNYSPSTSGAAGGATEKKAVEVEDRLSQDWGRRFLPDNGGCAYIDLNHLELCLPETLSAFDHVACWQAMLRIARRARRKANEKMDAGEKIEVLINNSDGLGNSYGSHLNFLLTRRAWNNLFRTKLHHLLYLAAFQTSSIVFTGQGKVGSENGAPGVDFQISQRADFFETLIGEQTTHRRPIVNSRDEPLCGRKRIGSETARQSSAQARLHVIFYDSNLCQVANLLKVGVMQIILAMIEAERINPELILDDPLVALQNWSHDPTLVARARLVSGREVTAVELQLQFLEEARHFIASGGGDGIVPRADEILTLWEETLADLAAKHFDALAPRLDWVLKWTILRRVLNERPDLDWGAPEIKHLDLLYSSLDDREGLYWAYEQSGLVERIVSEAEIVHFCGHPPADTRAWTRASLLRWAGPEISGMDWDYIDFRISAAGWWPRTRTLDLANPLGFTEQSAGSILQRMDATLDELLDELGAAAEEDSLTAAANDQRRPASGAASTLCHPGRGDESRRS